MRLFYLVIVSLLVVIAPNCFFISCNCKFIAIVTSCFQIVTCILQCDFVSHYSDFIVTLQCNNCNIQLRQFLITSTIVIMTISGNCHFFRIVATFNSDFIVIVTCHLKMRLFYLVIASLHLYIS